MQAEEGSSVILRCEISKPGIPVEWRKEDEVLKNSVKYQIRKRETTLELLIWKPVPEDGGVYSCVCADHMTSATVRITGRTLFTNELIKEYEAICDYLSGLNGFLSSPSHLQAEAEERVDRGGQHCHVTL